ncbi:hypothetical protein J1N09_12635 [Aureitalea sp. L0-47]|uniref:tail fiber protein n=1 Tax=Aureitalea sp. L0-47 TaxID=2816962 RepID=UPI002238A8B6|nr:tail fiber protein [Aureitalea sp. L0-47]MCW5520688.1 hypothetical protein [Aureitalea sp. L0-47]
MKNFLILSCLLIVSTSFAQRNFSNLTERNGKIGIGTKSPDELLTVKGKIHTQEVLVDLNGAVAPDYVFENYFSGASELKPEYSFPTLQEVASYVEEQHHLPGIPSAKELEAEGLSLKEMNLLLLQKIEELTLYTLEQQKEIEALKEKMAKLEE